MHTDTGVDKSNQLASLVQSVQNKKMEEEKLAKQPAPKPSNSNVGELKRYC